MEIQYQTGVTTPCFYVGKSIEVGKSLISSSPRQFKRNLKRLGTMLLPPNFKFNISKY